MDRRSHEKLEPEDRVASEMCRAFVLLLCIAGRDTSAARTVSPVESDQRAWG